MHIFGFVFVAPRPPPPLTLSPSASVLSLTCSCPPIVLGHPPAPPPYEKMQWAAVRRRELPMREAVQNDHDAHAPLDTARHTYSCPVLRVPSRNPATRASS